MQLAMHMVTIEDLMPQEHLLRKLETALDLSFVYEETAPLYSKKYGRPAIDPVVIVKYLLVGFLYGIPSERQIERRVQTDIALRWYLGLDLFDRVPDHSTVSQLRRRQPPGLLFAQMQPLRPHPPCGLYPPAEPVRPPGAGAPLPHRSPGDAVFRGVRRLRRRGGPPWSPMS